MLLPLKCEHKQILFWLKNIVEYSVSPVIVVPPNPSFGFNQEPKQILFYWLKGILHYFKHFSLHVTAILELWV